ncbi:PEPxxWA-CTERM sorting domain-containing protein [Phenylobacterium sp.]|uniref:PEPxxWA-CTERM sorting domain-containing protein n=1 Tax=Phenylobacterium sp. TaxID=1871053 RepID=UPI0025F7DE64|nr:PEPxxWA-CTERM sorting domain-containing protein [Phenylobacterium sp.]
MAIAAAVALGALSAAHAADLAGAEVTVNWLYPDTATTFETQSFTVGPGPELTCPGGAVGGGLCGGFQDSSVVDIGANTLSLTITGGDDVWNPAGFNGYEFSGLSAGGPWSGYTLSTDFSGLDASRITFTPDAVFVNMEGIAPTAGESFTISLDAGGPVPEPASWALMILGFGMAGATVRRLRGIPGLSRA